MELYHGTNESFSTFDIDKESINSTTFGPVSIKRHGIFLSDNDEFAKQYGKNLMVCDVEIDNLVVLDESLKLKFTDTLNPFDDERDMWLLAKYSKSDWALFENELGAKFVNFIQSLGYDGITFQETLEDSTGEYFGNTYVVFSDKQLRCRVVSHP